MKASTKKASTKVAKPKAEPKPADSSFKAGETVEKQLFFMGKITEKVKQKIHSISKGVIYLCDPNEGYKETGITYNLKGEEIEKFFAPHSISKIVKVKK